jgi:hypothetical protein
VDVELYPWPLELSIFGDCPHEGLLNIPPMYEEISPGPLSPAEVVSPVQPLDHGEPRRQPTPGPPRSRSPSPARRSRHAHYCLTLPVASSPIFFPSPTFTQSAQEERAIAGPSLSFPLAVVLIKD